MCLQIIYRLQNCKTNALLLIIMHFPFQVFFMYNLYRWNYYYRSVMIQIILALIIILADWKETFELFKNRQAKVGLMDWRCTASHFAWGMIMSTQFSCWIYCMKFWFSRICFILGFGLDAWNGINMFVFLSCYDFMLFMVD